MSVVRGKQSKGSKCVRNVEPTSESNKCRIRGTIYLSSSACWPLAMTLLRAAVQQVGVFIHLERSGNASAWIVSTRDEDMCRVTFSYS